MAYSGVRSAINANVVAGTALSGNGEVAVLCRTTERSLSRRGTHRGSRHHGTCGASFRSIFKLQFLKIISMTISEFTVAGSRFRYDTPQGQRIENVISGAVLFA